LEEDPLSIKKRTKISPPLTHSTATRQRC